MFDIGFSELMVIAVVALVVIGPERLPKVARTLGHLFGRMQRYVTDVKADINREMKLDELRKYQEQFKAAASTAEHTFTDEVVKTEQLIKATPEVEGVISLPEQSLIEPAEVAVHEDEAQTAQLELGFDSKVDASPNPPKQV